MDDEEMVGEITCQMLGFLGFEGVHVYDGLEAIREYALHRERGTPFAAVIMDLSVPCGMGGREAVGKIIAMDDSALVFVSSGYSNDPAMVNYREYGFSGVIGKPFNLETLKDLLQVCA